MYFVLRFKAVQCIHSIHSGPLLPPCKPRQHPASGWTGRSRESGASTSDWRCRWKRNVFFSCMLGKRHKNAPASYFLAIKNHHKPAQYQELLAIWVCGLFKIHWRLCRYMMMMMMCYLTWLFKTIPGFASLYSPCCLCAHPVPTMNVGYNFNGAHWHYSAFLMLRV